MTSTTGHGGMLYLNGPRISLSMTGFSVSDKLRIGTSGSTLGSGGLIYSNSA